MQPQNNPAPTPSQQPDYGFILQDGQKPKKGFRLPGLKLPKPVAGVLLGAFLLLLIFSIVALRGSKSSPMFDVAARQTEMLRLADLATSNVKDDQTKNLVATVKSVFSTEQRQSASYLGAKISDGRFKTYLNKNVDSELETAGQNNRYDDAYLSLLKSSLAAYINSVQSASTSASATEKSLLQTDLADAKTLLAAPQLNP